MKPPKNQKVAQAILDAAQARFLTQGFQKTSIADLAADCQMSPANLYRYFDGKKEIGAQVVARFVKHSRALADQFRNLPDLTAAKRIEGFCLEILRFNHHVFLSQTHLFELIRLISNIRPQMAKEHVGIKVEFLEHCLTLGLKNGEFAPGEVSGQTLFNGLIKFLMPHFIAPPAPPLPELESQALSVLQLLFKGLAKR
ncbi:MAG: hypothetical protein A2508_08995 [Candidatus Lambdaproteobacteria bacterium RIFOXYD12_FULL_49_8]|uniref:HTH tetR-type domain-containing protein n=1 Tax=Candidatus Lambdaproteobacteria bacterium RIFOXYD2_FULL_50_16 TaxID=1817772 RepID=A0A1F6GAQ4_9PROT|nr:MAG: hypothetical protein A2527_08330 [Candidatus Lambdaproteobacteria bacterium RIFOXYD2_FULL_50_16]OGG97936.1 MAG: hypothetical protein A2508_08995 [Candidatus Lambdaproteobacteria bacterium RIFOXYD12_FULL_49_8]